MIGSSKRERNHRTGCSRCSRNQRDKEGNFSFANLPACIGLKTRDIHSELRATSARIPAVRRKSIITRCVAVASSKLNGQTLSFKLSAVYRE